MTTLRPVIVINRPVAYNVALHGQFLSACQQLDINPIFWGPACEGASIIRYDPKLPLDKLPDELGCNLVILYRAAWTDLDFLPSHVALPTNVPTILIDVDFWHRRHQITWDTHTRVALHLLRHPSDVPFSRAKQKDSLPFSVDPGTYHPGPANNRKGICLSGAAQNPIYCNRALAAKLTSANIPTDKLILSRQAEYYRQHLAALTCGCQDLRYLTGKHFEIAATGTVLFTDGDNGIEDTLPPDTYVKYRQDGSDVARLWSDVQNNQNHWEIAAAKAAGWVLLHHTHAERWVELIEKINRHLGTNFTSPGPAGRAKQTAQPVPATGIPA